MTDDIDNEGTHSPGHGAHGGEREARLLAALEEALRDDGYEFAHEGPAVKDWIATLAAASPDGAGVPVAHLHSNGDVCMDRMPQSTVWPIDLYAAPQAQPEPSELRKALQMAVLQNSHDMLMTGDELRQCQRALAIPMQHAEASDGYVQAFYELAKLMGIPAQPASSETVWREQMLPKLNAVLATPQPEPSVQPPVEASEWTFDNWWSTPNRDGALGAQSFHSSCDPEATEAAACHAWEQSRALATPQPPAPVVPLTDAQIDAIYRDVWSSFPASNRLARFARAIEAAHRIGDKP